MIFLCFKTNYLNEEVKRTEPSPLVSVPCYEGRQLQPQLHVRVFKQLLSCYHIKAKASVSWKLRAQIEPQWWGER
jgi:hypothetical protein